MFVGFFSLMIIMAICFFLFVGQFVGFLCRNDLVDLIIFKQFYNGQGFLAHTFILEFTPFMLNISGGLDLISIVFLSLSVILIIVCFLVSWGISYRADLFVLLLFFLDITLFVLFYTTDFLTFYLAFESSVIPMFLLIGFYGSRSRRIHATYQFLFYTVLGSFGLLLSVIYLCIAYGSTDFMILREAFANSYSTGRAFLYIVWLFLFIAFGAKMPIFPFHIWLPEAHVEASTVGSVLLAGILLKMGGYGFLRCSLFLFPEMIHRFFLPLVYTLVFLGIFYISFTILCQIDLKKIIAYSSIAHMSFVLFGLFSFSVEGVGGAIFLMLSHGVVSALLFIFIGAIYGRYRTRNLFYFRGLVQFMPFLATSFFLTSLANIGFPGTSGFTGEFLILLGAAKFDQSLMTALVISTFFGAVYTLWLYCRIFFGMSHFDFIVLHVDLTRRESMFIGPLVCVVLIFGLISGGNLIHLINIALNVMVMQC